MSDNRNVSQTAMLIASLRALACYEDDPRVQGGDHLAELFLPEDKRAPLQNPEARGMIKKMIPAGLYEYVIARTKYFDELFERHLENQTPQIVLLGAGYDSRAYRLGDKSSDAIIYETDLRATQEDKRRILTDNHVEIPWNIRYVAVDFEKDDLFDMLAGAGFDNSLQTLFIWEGVTFYLSPPSVRAMLSAVKENSAPGSILAFDYQQMESDGDLIDSGLRDEKIRFGVHALDEEGYFAAFGYSVLEKVNAEQIGERYLALSDGRRLGRIHSIMNFIRLKV